ncbi:hypothetical protein JCM11251_000310 [Rhodosporidiobolus azoricus]
MAPAPATGPLSIPTVSFRPLPLSNSASTLHPNEPYLNPQPPPFQPQLAGYGYNASAQWDAYSAIEKDGEEGGGRYLRWLQPMETELAKQVEYDMDDQDQLWLDSLNVDRKREGHPQISYEVFEIIMDKIEKEWFDLTKNIPKKSNAVPTEDARCAICDDGECENSNAIVFCDGCNLAVHQDCYGVPYIPEGQWLCRKCTVSPEKPVHCVLCPLPYGAFKQTTSGQWAHLLCAIWIPDTGVSNTVYMEPVDGVEGISKSRWKLVCYLCKKRLGACIQCANRSCYTAFHPTCAREYGLELKMKTSTGAPAGELKAYCDKHGERPAPPALIRALTHSKARGGSAAQYLKKLGSATTGLGSQIRKTHKTAHGYSSSTKKKGRNAGGPPVVPAAIAEKVVKYLSGVKVPGGKKREVVDCVSRYWSLKREGRRGAPLLKRIHLEPWTASASTHRQSSADKAAKLSLLRLLRNDLEKVRMLTEQVRKREKKKLERAVLLREVVQRFVWPKEGKIREILGNIKALDKSSYFSSPVDRAAVPDYYDVIKCPMDWSTVSDKLERHEYERAGDFIGDIHLVINNARRYNKPHSPVHKAAVRILDSALPWLEDLEHLDDPASEANLLQTGPGLVELLNGGGVVKELWEVGYDTQDPGGEKAKKKERDERESRADGEEVEKEEKGREKEAAAKARKGAKKDAKGKGKAKAADEEEGEEDDAMDVDDQDEPAAATPAGQANVKSGKKRSATTAGLDSPAPAASTRPTRATAAAAAEKEKEASTPTPRTTRSGRSGETPVPAPAKKGKEKATAPNGRKTAREKKVKGKAVEATESEEEEPEEEAHEEEEEEDMKPPPAKKQARGQSTSEAPPVAVSTPKLKALAMEDVGAKDSFLHFETGWILPEGTSRRRSSALPTPALANSSSTPAAPAHSSNLAASSSSKSKIPAPAPPASPAPTPARKAINALAVANASPQKGEGGTMTVRDWEERFRELSKTVAITEKTELEDGYLVWARLPGYAWHPAEAVDPDDPDTPEVVRKTRPPANSGKVAVYFFGENRTTAWVARNFLRELGENEEFDAMLLDSMHLRAVNKQAKKSNSGLEKKLEELKSAYEEAKERMETSEDEEERLATEKASGKKAAPKKGGKKAAKGKSGGRKR